MEKLDELYAEGQRISHQLVFASLLWPALNQGEGFESSLADALDRENAVCAFSEDVRRALENLLALESDFGLESSRTEAMLLAEESDYSDALRLLEARVAAGDAEEETLRFWKAFEGFGARREDDDDESEAAPEDGGFFDNPELNALLDEQREALAHNVWAELRIPQSIHGITDADLSPNALEVGHKLIDMGYEAYIIGGAMRDIILGVPCNDFDIVTSAMPDKWESILGEMRYHSNENGAVFGIKDLGGESIDIATFQNVPKAYEGLEGLPDFDPDTLYGESILQDAFERDQAMNAIYYDLRTGELVDFLGGICQLREGVIDSPVEPQIWADFQPQRLVRALRFKARYGFDFSERLETLMRERGREIVGRISPQALPNQLLKMWGKGYSVACANALREYGLFGVCYNPAAELCETDDYWSEVTEALQSMDDSYMAGQPIDNNMSVAIFMYPVVRERAAEIGMTAAIEETLDALEQTYAYYKDARAVITGCLEEMFQEAAAA